MQLREVRGRRLRRGLAGVLVAVLMTVAAAPAGAAAPVAAGKWAKKVCAAVDTWLVAVEAATAEPAPAGDLLAAAAALDTLLEDTEAATRALVKRVKKAGVPDLPKGAKIARTYREVYGDLTAALGDGLDALRSVDRGSPDAAVDAFPNAVAEAQLDFEAALIDAQEQIESADVLASGPLTKVLRRVPSCVAITG